MRHCRFARCADLLMGLTLTMMAAPTLACVGTDCKGVARAQPLDLTQFMRHPGAKSTGQAANQRPAVRPPIAKRQEWPTRLPPSTAAPLPVEAAAAYASQSGPAVGVVASDELNEIDILGDAAAPGTNTAAQPADHAVKLTDASELNEIDRKVENLRLTSAGAATTDRDTLARSDQAADSRLQKIWAALQGAPAALVAAGQATVRVTVALLCQRDTC